jgi:hypothetical protein
MYYNASLAEWLNCLFVKENHEVQGSNPTLGIKVLSVKNFKFGLGLLGIHSEFNWNFLSSLRILKFHLRVGV